MARITFEGLEGYMESLQRIEADSQAITERAVYEGAAVVADAVKEAIRTLPTDQGWGTRANPLQGISPTQKEGLIDSFGVAPMQDDQGFLHVKIGFDGYNRVKSRKYPKGQPNAMIARAAESGTSFLKKTPFMAPAIRQAKPEAKKRMQRVFEEALNERRQSAWPK